MDEQLNTLSAIYIYIAVAFIILYMLRKEYNIHFLQETVECNDDNACFFTLHKSSITWWMKAHFLLYLILGYLCPKYLKLIIVIGILWEIFEYSIKDLEHGKYDIFMNSIGLLIGVLLTNKKY